MAGDCFISEALRREIADKNQQIQVYQDKLFNIYMGSGLGLDKKEESGSSNSAKILEATEEQNRLLRELIENRDAEIGRLEAKLSQNEGDQDIVQLCTCFTKKIRDVSEQCTSLFRIYLK